MKHFQLNGLKSAPASGAGYVEARLPGPAEPRAHEPAAAVGVPLPPKGSAVP